MPETVDEIEDLCGNCLRPDRELVAVRRVYVVPESWERPASSTTVDEIERWCASCRSIYPHEVVDAPGAEPSD